MIQAYGIGSLIRTILHLFFLIGAHTKQGAIGIFFVFMALPTIATAHQPRLTLKPQTVVPNPEVGKVYYGILEGKPHIYRINADEPFDLYVQVLVPDIAGQKKDVSAAIFKGGNDGRPIAVLDGDGFDWKRYWEKFGRDWYWMGPEYRTRAEAGWYEIHVQSSDNDSKYSLAIGETEKFGAREVIDALNLLPRVKSNFFDKSPIGFMLSPFGYGYIFIVYLLAFALGFIYRATLRMLFKNSPRGISKNIDGKGRLLRFTIGLGLLLGAITSTWSPILIFFSGFSVFEALFSWCGFYAILGKNMCPVN